MDEGMQAPTATPVVAPDVVRSPDDAPVVPSSVADAAGFGQTSVSGSADEDEPCDVDATTRPRPRWPGVVAVGIASIMVVTWTVALALSMGGDLAVGTTLAWVAIGMSVLGAAVGVTAVVGRWGRAWGVTAILVSVLLNPVVLARGLDLLGVM